MIISISELAVALNAAVRRLYLVLLTLFLFTNVAWAQVEIILEYPEDTAEIGSAYGNGGGNWR